MYAVGQSTQSSILIRSAVSSSLSFCQTTILIFSILYTLKFYRQITLKQALFGDNYRESATSLVIAKSDLLSSKSTPESLFVALFVRWLITNLSLSNLELKFSGSSIQVQARTTTYWLYFYDQPLDDYNNLDTSKLLNPDNF